MENGCATCAEHLQHREQISNVNKNIEDIKEAMATFAAYMPKIEQTLVQLGNVHKTLEESAKTNNELFTKLDRYREELYEFKLKLEKHEIEINTNKDRYNDFKRFKYQMLGGLLLLVIGSGVTFSYKVYADLTERAPVVGTVNK